MPDSTRRIASSISQVNKDDYYYIIGRIDDLLTAINVTVDTVGQLATKQGQHTIDVERINTRIDVLLRERNEKLDKLDERIDTLEKWQSRLIGMFAVVVLEIPVALTIASIMFHK